MFHSTSFVAFCLRQVIALSAERLASWVDEHFVDSSQALPDALSRAHQRAWQTFGLALRGDSWLTRLNELTTGLDVIAFRDQVRDYLDVACDQLRDCSVEFREQALEEYRRLWKADRFQLEGLSGRELGLLAAGFERFTDPLRLTQAAQQAVRDLGDTLHTEAPHLARLTCQPYGEGRPPLLAAAFAFFFRRELERSPELARGLALENLDRIGSDLSRGFVELESLFSDGIGQLSSALIDIGASVDEHSRQLSEIVVALEEIRAQLREVVGAPNPEFDFGDEALSVPRESVAAAITPEPIPLPEECWPGRRITLRFSASTEPVEMDFAWIPPGSFMMGASAHKVTISHGFWMGVYPVTHGQWRAIMNAEPSGADNEDDPVSGVSWFDGQYFCQAMSRLCGQTVRLPSEAEWEYACRAGTNTLYWGGDNEVSLGIMGWYQGNSGGQPRPIGQLAVNAWGLFDMHGNVWEWCQDWYDVYLARNQTDPTGPLHGEKRVLRGGAFDSPPEHCQCGYRYALVPSARRENLGLRVMFRAH